MSHWDPNRDEEYAALELEIAHLEWLARRGGELPEPDSEDEAFDPSPAEQIRVGSAELLELERRLEAAWRERKRQTGVAVGPMREPDGRKVEER